MTERMQANALKRLFAVLVEIAEANQKESEETMSVPDETEIKPRFAETYSHVAPRCYMRINVTKNTKGYSYETTVSVESDDPVATGDLVKEMLIDADLIAHDEIERRETENSGEL